MLNKKGNYQILTSFFFIITVVVSVLVLIYFGLNSSVVSSLIFGEMRPIQDSTNVLDSITKCWGTFSFFELNIADASKCFNQVKDSITGYRVEIIDFLECSQKDFNSKDFGKTMNCKTKVPYIISINKNEKTTCLGRLTLCFNESKKTSTNFSSVKDTQFPATIASGCDEGLSKYSLNESEKIIFSCKDNYACKNLTYSVTYLDGTKEYKKGELNYDEDQKQELFLYPGDVDINYKINYYSSDSANKETSLIYYCAIKGQHYVNPQIFKSYFKINEEESEINFFKTYKVDSRMSVILKAKLNKPMSKALFLLDYANCPDQNISLGQEPSIIGDFNYYAQWIVPKKLCNGTATGKFVLIDEKNKSVESSSVNFDINSQPFDVNIMRNNLRDFNVYGFAIGQFGRITNDVNIFGKDINKDSCYYSINGGINWSKADWNNYLNGCDSGVIDLNKAGFSNFSFNTKISNTFNETAYGVKTPVYYLDLSPPSITMYPTCPNYSFLNKTKINFYCNDYPMGTNFGCGSKSVFFRINGGDWNNIDSGDGKLLDLDGNFLLEAYSVDRFGQQSYRILSSYCALEQTRIYLRNAEIKDDNLQLALYQFGGVQVDLYKGIDKLDTLNSDSNVSKEFVLPLYDGLTSLDKLKICFPSGKCSPEINVFEVSTDLEKGKKAEFCGGEYSSISAVNLCLFSDFNSISDIDSSTCEYSLDGSDWTTATYSTFNAKRGCKVIIPKIDYSTHYISFRVSKTDSTVVFSPSSKALIQYNSVVTLCKYADCS